MENACAFGIRRAAFGIVRVTFLGTGTSHGVPMIGCSCATCTSPDPRDRRLRPSILIETEDGAFVLVDTATDLRTQALALKVPRVDAILFTHSHADHIFGLDDVRRFNVLQGGAIPCWADERSAEDIRRAFWYIFEPGAPRGGGLPEIDLHVVDGQVRLGAATFVPVPILHGKRIILGWRVDRFAYLTDCSGIPDESWPLLGGVEAVVVGALRDRPHPTHFTLDQAVEAARRIGAARVWFTHMTHDLPHAATCARLPTGMALAYDGLVVDV
jgi:phosphoribosyl 1,2-cyclic phosphate phosphodiesterase